MISSFALFQVDCGQIPRTILLVNCSATLTECVITHDACTANVCHRLQPRIINDFLDQ